MLTAIYDLLRSDSALMGLLTGGLYLAQDVQSISRQSTPAAYDAYKELLPCGLLKEETTTPWGPHPHSARQYVTLWLYQRYSYSAIGPARARVYALLHRQRLAVPGCWQIEHATDLTNQVAPGLEVPMEISRYVVSMERG